MPADTKTVPLALLHEADGLLSLVAHRYRVHEIPRDLCEELIACSHKLRNIAAAPTLPEPRPDDEGRETAYAIADGVELLRRMAREHAPTSISARASRAANAIERSLSALTPLPAPLGATDEGLQAAVLWAQSAAITIHCNYQSGPECFTATYHDVFYGAADVVAHGRSWEAAITALRATMKGATLSLTGDRLCECGHAESGHVEPGWWTGSDIACVVCYDGQGGNPAVPPCKRFRAALHAGG